VLDVPATKYASEGDVRIAYQVVGDGPLDLFFVPGGQFPVDLIWEEPASARFLRRLSSFSRMVLFDARGWGASRTTTETTPTYEAWADDLRLVMDTVGIERAAVVGFFAGAVFSTYFAAAHPERVSSLVMLEGFARVLRDSDYAAGMTPEALETGSRTYVQGYGSGEDLAFMAPSKAADEQFRSWWGRCERLANGPVAAGLYWRALASRDLRAVLPALRVLTLVLHRRGDRFIRVAHGRFLAEHVPGAKYVELEGDDHLFMAGDSDRLLDEIELFLTGLKGGHDPDRVLASVLFTDIVASTNTAAALGDRRWRELLDQHDSLMRAQVDRFRAAWSRQLATVCSPPSIGQPARSAARVRSEMPPAASASNCGPVSTPGRSSNEARISAASRYISPLACSRSRRPTR
jgi:pimeloyl-ACP methyl ester carboxylesterase